MVSQYADRLSEDKSKTKTWNDKHFIELIKTKDIRQSNCSVMNQQLSQIFAGSPKCEWYVPLKLVCAFTIPLVSSYCYGDDNIAMLDWQFN